MGDETWVADDRRLEFLVRLPGVLRAVPADGDVVAASEPHPAGVALTFQRRYASSIAGGSAAVPVLGLDPPVDAVWLADAWGIERPLGVSGDVHQHSWHLLVAGDELPDPHRRRLAATDPIAGEWTLRVLLDGRPTGPVPDVACGASPAYDLRATGGWVVSITVEPPRG